MRALVQRVTRAAVRVDGTEVGAIAAGLLVLVGVTHGDDASVARRLADKVWHLRIFPSPDEARGDEGSGAMERSVGEVGGELCVVSQFTLYGSTRRGRRPSWGDAAPPGHAEPLVEAFSAALRDLGGTVATGRFGARMEVELVNDGPVTLLVEVSGVAG